VEPDPIAADNLGVPVRSVLLATLTLLLAAPAAHAATTTVTLKVPRAQTIFGHATRMSGTVLADGVPVANVPVQLEGRRYPFESDWAVVDTTTTAADGTYAFSRTLDRNWQFRATAAGATSARGRVYVAPFTKFSIQPRSSKLVRFTQRYRVPKGVRLKQPTIFYVGPRKGKSIPRVASAKLTRTRAGRYTSTAMIRLKPAWNGFFRYASCFRYTGGSGMGNPRAGCAHRYRFG
jgi:hypothetical protein